MISTLITDRNSLIGYPCLMESIPHPGLVLLFSSDNVATVVAVPPNYDSYTVGEHHGDFDPSAFALFGGELNLCNEADFDLEDETLMAGLGDEENHALGSLVEAFEPSKCDTCPDRADCSNSTKPGATEPPVEAAAKPDETLQAVRTITLSALRELIAKPNAASQVKHA